jgi:hypothetical protein
MWTDDDEFLALGPQAKYVYTFLVGQPDLGHSGIITLRIPPWSRRLGISPAQVEAALEELHAQRFVVMDPDEMLLLVRALIRRDFVYRQPNVFKSAADQIYATPSRPVRRALLAELERLDAADMKGDTAQVCSELIAWLRKSSENPSPDPSGKGSGNPSGERNRLDAHFEREDTDGAGEEGSANPSDNPSVNPPSRAHVRALSPTPSPTPTPLAAGALFEVADAAPANGSAGKPRKAKAAKPQDPEVAARNKLAVDLVKEWYEAQSPKPAGKYVGYHQIAVRLLEAGHEPDVIAQAFKRCGISLTLASVQFQLQRIAETGGNSVVAPLHRGRNPYMETEDRTYGSLASAFETSGA